jgi:hypothetical protein
MLPDMGSAYRTGFLIYLIFCIIFVIIFVVARSADYKVDKCSADNFLLVYIGM